MVDLTEVEIIEIAFLINIVNFDVQSAIYKDKGREDVMYKEILDVFHKTRFFLMQFS